MSIKLHQGKSLKAAIVLYNPDGSEYEYDGSITRVVFGVKSGEFGDLLIEKELEYDNTENAFILQLDPEDTEDLPEGTYTYDISYYTDEGFWDLIPADDFIILRGVTKQEVQNANN